MHFIYNNIILLKVGTRTLFLFLSVNCAPQEYAFVQLEFISLVLFFSLRVSH